SLPGITVTDTINNTHKVGYYLAGTTYDKIDNCYNRADFVMVPLGSGRPTWVKFKTPWLNAGSYNVYISHRVSGDPKTNMGSITMDGKELYYPNEEMYGRWFKSWAGANDKRQWNAKAHSGNMAMNYIGSVSVDNSGTHSLKINVLPENGATYNLDMLEFIPVDMDSLSINTTAAVSMAKIYYPMFDWVGFSRMPGYDAAAIPTSYADFTNFAIPYQVTDLTDWGTKFSHTIDSVGLIKKLIGSDEFVANYVTVYRAEDKWTRVSEGYSDSNAMSYTCELPKGDYYYEAINFTDLADGAADFRTFINSGTFSVGPTGLINTSTSKIKAFAVGKTLTVKGIEPGAKVVVVDITGRIVSNTIATSNVFTKELKQSIYIVKVISANETLKTKVIIK
ncbi:MAG TPA: T9SS type A sorting domain-containing protein, partial [Paludibacter sp.]